MTENEFSQILEEIGLGDVEFRKVQDNNLREMRAAIAGADFLNLRANKSTSWADLYLYNIVVGLPTTTIYSDKVTGWSYVTSSPYEVVVCNHVMIPTEIKWSAALVNGTQLYKSFSAPNYGTYVRFECDLIVNGAPAGTAQRR